MKKKRDSVVAILVVLFICLFLRLAQFLPPGEMRESTPTPFPIYEHLQLGMTRSEVRPYMLQYAWRRYECKFGDSIREVYCTHKTGHKNGVS